MNKKETKQMLLFYSNIAKTKPKPIYIGNISWEDELTNECIKKLGVKDEELADDIFASVYNYIFGLEDTEDDFNDIVSFLKEES